MKKNQSIVRVLMALVIMFGVETTANAQLGGLLKKAKSAVKDKAKSEVKEAGASDNKKSTASADGSIVLTHIKTNKEMGRYYPDEKKYVSAQGLIYLFGDDGAVTFGDDGSSAGKVTAQGFSTRGLKQIDYNAEKNWYEWNGKYFGVVSDKEGGTNASLMGENWVKASAHMDHMIMAFCTYGTSYNDETLGGMINGYKDQEIARVERQKKMDEARKKAAASSSNSGGDMEFRKNGSIVGSMLADGTVYVGGRIAGKIDAEGNIYVGGHIEGTLRDNGEVLKNGHVIGSIDDGTVRLNGHIVGGIDSRTGDVRYNGSIIGRVEPVANVNKAAVFYFFGFY